MLVIAGSGGCTRFGCAHCWAIPEEDRRDGAGGVHSSQHTVPRRVRWRRSQSSHACAALQSASRGRPLHHDCWHLPRRFQRYGRPHGQPRPEGVRRRRQLQSAWSRCETSVFVSASKSVSSPRKLFVFVIEHVIYRIKVHGQPRPECDADGNFRVPEADAKPSFSF